MEVRIRNLIQIFVFLISPVFAENSESVDYYNSNGTSLPPPYHLSSAERGGYDSNVSTAAGSSEGFTKGLVEDSEEENLNNQGTTQRAPHNPTTETAPAPQETEPPQTIPPGTTTTLRPLSPTTPTHAPNTSSTNPSVGFSTQASDDNLDNKGNGPGGSSFNPSPINPAPAGPSPGGISDGPGGAINDDAGSFCLCLSLCLTQTGQPQAAPGNGPCVSICACIGASMDAAPTPAPPGAIKDTPGGQGPAAVNPIGDLPSVGTDTAHGAVQDGTGIAGSQAPVKDTTTEEPEDSEEL